MSKSNAAKSRGRSKARIVPPTHRVTFSHTDKMMFPEARLTKGDILNYYERIAPYLLPYLADRPVTIERLPDGLARPDAPRFWQKNTPSYYPDWIPRVELPSETGKDVQYALVNDVDTLLYLVNQGSITFHVYLSRITNLNRPDYVLFDLDRSESTFGNVVTIARKIRELLKRQDIESFPKTSGKSGLHLLVKWNQTGGYDEARQWAMTIAMRAVHALPTIATIERRIAARDGRVYIDVVQNALGHHVVPPYVIRATPAASVATPLRWTEVTARLNPARFDPSSVLKRMGRLKRDPMAALGVA